MIEMEVVGVALEPNTNRPLVWLKDKDQRVFLPIAIGNFEATAIYMALYDELPPRPITYDLLRSILEGMDAQVSRVLINSLQDDIFYAEVRLDANGRSIEVDSRPSDAIALALRVGAPVYVEEAVVQEAGLPIDETLEAEIEGLEGEGDYLKEAEVGALEAAPKAVQPAGGIMERVVTLKEKLQKAVAQEEYEEAARLRDEIGRLEHQIR